MNGKSVVSAVKAVKVASLTKEETAQTLTLSLVTVKSVN